jgi:arylsulfatase
VLSASGPGLPTTFGGEVRTATMDRICAAALLQRFPYHPNVFADTASLLTGRNHQRSAMGRSPSWPTTGTATPGDPTQQRLVAGSRDYGTRRGVGQVAQHPGGRHHGGRSIRGWPTGWASVFLQVPGRGFPVRAAPGATTPLSWRRRRRQEGYHLSGDLADDDPGCATAKAHTGPFFCTDQRHLHGPHHIMKNGPTGTPGSSTTAGTPTGSGRSSAPRTRAGSHKTVSSPTVTSE